MSSVNENTISKFSTNQAFRSREDLMNWVQDVGRKDGFVIVTKRSKTTPSGVMYKVILRCDRGGIFKSQSKKTDTSDREINSKKINCPFELAGTYSQINDFWTLQVKCDKHNHDPALYMEGHSYEKKLTDDETRLVADLTAKNVKPRDIYSTIKRQNENNKSTMTTIYNEVSKVRMKMTEGRTPMQNLFHTLQDKGYTFEFKKNEVSHELEELFFIHPTSLEIWRAFPHVLFIDATYKTNKYNLPFLQIIGVTSTKMSFSIAYVFMISEKECNYTWALKCLRSNMDGSVYPRVILTDRELALMNACERIFPEAAHFLCRWHISQAILRKCKRQFGSLKEWIYFNSKWTSLCESSTWDTYLSRYAELEAVLIEYEDVLIYLNEVWLEKYRQLFVCYWTDKVLNFGNYTTNRVESQHHLLKLHLGSSHSNLDRFVYFINQIVEGQHTEIKASLERSRIFINPKHNTYMFQHLLGSVSKNAIELIYQELQRSNGLEITFKNCGCILHHIPEQVGVLYRSINFFESGNAPFSNWMIMSDTGAMIASYYNVIVHFISEKENTTWLPLWSSPPENPQNVTWVIGFVHGNHYVKVDLQGNYPLPQIHPQWDRFKRDCATEWKRLYLSRV